MASDLPDNVFMTPGNRFAVKVDRETERRVIVCVIDTEARGPDALQPEAMSPLALLDRDTQRQLIAYLEADR